MTQTQSLEEKHGAPDAGTVGFFHFAASKSKTGNAGLDEALERLGEAIAERTPEQEAAAKARAEFVRATHERHVRELAEARKARVPGDRRFLAVFARALADAKRDKMNPGDAARLCAKRTAHFFVANVDGAVIDRVAKIYRAHGARAVRAVGAELAREVAAKPAKFQNAISVLDWRLRKRGDQSTPGVAPVLLHKAKAERGGP